MLSFQNGKVFICDNDNVALDGTEIRIIGKPRVMAFEMVLCKSKSNSLRNRFSMFLILFELFLEGRYYQELGLIIALHEKLYGKESLFIMGSNSHSNGLYSIVYKNSNVVWQCLYDYK